MASEAPAAPAPERPRAGPATDRPLVALSHVSRRFDELTAVDDVSLEVAPGAILGVIGPSGSGKTTLVRMLTGTLLPSAGEVRVLGEEPRRFRRQTRERIGYMPQSFVLYDELTTAENLAFVASLFGLLWFRRRRRVRAMLELLGLWDARNRRARQLSGGMQRRLALACALVHEPTLLLVDEPTAGLDPDLRRGIWDEFHRLRDLGRTLLVTTQYVGEAEDCDQVAVLSDGKLIALAPPEELRRAALGGEVVELLTTRPFDGASLRDLPGVLDVRQSGPTRLLVVADDAGRATPRLFEALAANDVPVASLNEYRPSFDEVFSELVARQDGKSERADAARAA